MKTCSRCEQNKQLSEFYKDHRNRNGRCSECKICYLKRSKEYKQTKRGKETQKRYRQTAKYKAVKKRYEQSEKGKLVQKRFDVHNPDYHKATHAVNNAIRDGKLPRPDTLFCHYCPAQAQQYHHWHGYEKEHWLDVIPACKKCHDIKHRKIA